MRRRLNLFITICTVSVWAHAQWTSSDSLALKRILNSEEEIKINPDVIRQIDFGFMGDPLISNDSPGLNYDETLPKSDYLQKNKFNYVFTLNVYKPTTKFNYDPIFNRKIKVDINSWHTKTYEYLFKFTIYSNWAKNWYDSNRRNSVEQIQAAGVRQVLIGTRTSGYTPTYNILPVNSNGLNLGGGKTMVTTGAGSTIGGMDLMKPFTKEFWNRSAAKRRARTLQVISNY